MKKLMIAAICSLFFINAFAKVEIKSVNGPTKTLVNVFAKDYSYPVEDIQKAVLQRLENEGLKGKKMKNNFFGFQEVRYNPLWTSKFDLYVGFAGSKNAGTIELLMATGYDNYMDTSDPELNKNVEAWLDELDLDIRTYIHNQKLEEAEKEMDKAEKEVDKLTKNRESLEKNIEKNENEIRKHQAQRTVATDTNSALIDPKQLAKDQKTAQKLENDRVKLNQKLDNNKQELNNAEKALSKAKEAYKDLKSKQPK